MTALPVLLPHPTPVAEHFLAAVSAAGVDLAVGRGPARPTGLTVVAHDLADESLARVLLRARRAGSAVVAVDAADGRLADRLRGVRFRALADRLVGRWVPDAALDDLDLGGLLADLGARPPAGGREGIDSVWLGDLADVARVHGRAFPDAAMTRLGPVVLDRYYRWQFIGPHPDPFARGAFVDGRLVGFLFGGRRHDAVSGFSRRFLPTVVAASLRHPLRARHLGAGRVAGVARLALRAGRGGSTRPSTPSEAARPPSFGVLSIAVVPEVQGSGLARGLLDAAVADARRGGFGGLHLSVDADNARAIRFYEREGWHRVDDGSGGASVLRMQRSIVLGAAD